MANASAPEADEDAATKVPLLSRISTSLTIYIEGCIYI
jgi:hypothetical protein